MIPLSMESLPPGLVRSKQEPCLNRPEQIENDQLTERDSPHTPPELGVARCSRSLKTPPADFYTGRRGHAQVRKARPAVAYTKTTNDPVFGLLLGTNIIRCSFIHIPKISYIRDKPSVFKALPITGPHSLCDLIAPYRS